MPNAKLPAEAHTFAVFRYRTGKSRNVDGKMVNHTTYDRCRGEAQEDGTVPETWPIAEYSPARVLEHWGAGRYRIDFFNAAGDRLSKQGHAIEVAEPIAKGPRLAKTKRRAARSAEEGDPEERNATPETMSAWDVMMMLDQREQRATDRARAQYEAQATRDREFMQMMMGMVRGAPSGPSAESSDLLKREIALSLDQSMFKLRKEIAGALAAREEEEPEEPEDPEEPAKDLNEAGERIGLALLRELEQRAPDLIEEAIPQIVSWLQKKGFTPSDRLRERMNASANGAHGADRE